MKMFSATATEWITWLQAAARLDAPTEGSDDDLIRRGKKGDRDAFARLVHRYQDRAFTLARGLVVSLGLHLVELDRRGLRRLGVRLGRLDRPVLKLTGHDDARGGHKTNGGCDSGNAAGKRRHRLV